MTETTPQERSGIPYTPVKWYQSLFAKLLIAFITFGVITAILAAAIASITHFITSNSDLPGNASPWYASEQIFIILSVASIVAIVVAVVSSFIISRYLTQPLYKIIAALQQVANNNLDVVVLLGKRKDELGTLANFFNIMIEKLKDTRKQEEGISDIKTQFVSVAAHQLRTPLTEIKWSLLNLLDGEVGELTPDQHKAVRESYTAVDGMMNLVNHFLNASKLEEKKLTLSKQALQIAPLIQKTIDELSALAKNKSITVIFEPDIPQDLTIYADPNNLQIVINNLLDNAIAYSKKGGEIRIKVIQDEKSIIISVKDSGIGIPLQAQKNIFSKFYRAENAKQAQTQGSGLGLFIARTIVNQHNGKIWFETRPDIGTTFYFSIPLT